MHFAVISRSRLYAFNLKQLCLLLQRRIKLSRALPHLSPSIPTSWQFSNSPWNRGDRDSKSEKPREDFPSLRDLETDMQAPSPNITLTCSGTRDHFLTIWTLLTYVDMYPSRHHLLYAGPKLGSLLSFPVLHSYFREWNFGAQFRQTNIKSPPATNRWSNQNGRRGGWRSGWRLIPQDGKFICKIALIVRFKFGNYFQEDMVCLSCTGTGERVCLSAEGFGNRQCFLEGIADRVTMHKSNS